METDEKNAQAIDEYIKGNEYAKTGITLKVKLSSGYQELIVYRFPIKLLKFRLENTRFEVKKYTYEKQHKKKIEQDTEEGKKIITSFLLYKDTGKILTDEAKDLIKDLKEHGQLQPGVITWDGNILNGNRRVASLNYLYDEDKKPIYEYFNAVRLLKNTTEKELFNVEADLQWANDLKSDYDPLAKYKMLERARKLYKVEEIASLTRKSKGKIKIELAELDLIQKYLKNRDDKDEEDFEKLHGQTEVFTEAAKLLLHLKKTLTKEYQKMFFGFVDINRKNPSTITNRDMRQVNKAFRNKYMSAIQLYERIDSSKTVKEIRALLDEGKYLVRDTSTTERPDKIAKELNKNAKKLYKITKGHKLSSSTIKSIKNTISVLTRIVK